MSIGVWLFYPSASDESAFILYLSVFGLTRIVTEFWKLFVRVEPRNDFRIPTQIHCVRESSIIGGCGCCLELDFWRPSMASGRSAP